MTDQSDQSESKADDLWADYSESTAGYYSDKINKALNKHAAKDIKLTYRQDKRRPNQPISVDDLALCMYAVSIRGPQGLSIMQVQQCFRTNGKPCHRAKASAMLRVLREIDCIYKGGGYQVGRYGQRYHIAGDRIEDIDWETFLDKK